MVSHKSSSIAKMNLYSYLVPRSN